MCDILCRFTRKRRVDTVDRRIGHVVGYELAPWYQKFIVYTIVDTISSAVENR